MPFWVKLGLSSLFGLAIVALGIYAQDSRGIAIGWLLMLIGPASVAYNDRRPQ